MEEKKMDIPQDVTPQKEDMSKSILVVLVVLAVAISVLGTFTVLSEINKLNSAPIYSQVNTAAKVSVTIIDPNPSDGASKTTGKVTFTVVKPGEN
jgi:hypothetical protein